MRTRERLQNQVLRIGESTEMLENYFGCNEGVLFYLKKIIFRYCDNFCKR